MMYCSSSAESLLSVPSALSTYVLVGYRGWLCGLMFSGMVIYLDL